MKLPALAARIHSLREISEERLIDFAPHKRLVQFLCIDASQLCPHPSRNHLPGQLPRRHPPNRKYRLKPSTLHLLHAIRPHILKKQIAKCDSFNPLGNCLRASPRHQRFILLIRTRPRQRHRPQRQPGSRSLPLHQLTPHRMHRHPPCLFVNRCHQPHYLALFPPPQNVQAPGAILPAAPRQENPLHKGTTPSPPSPSSPPHPCSAYHSAHAALPKFS